MPPDRPLPPGPGPIFSLSKFLLFFLSLRGIFATPPIAMPQSSQILPLPDDHRCNAYFCQIGSHSRHLDEGASVEPGGSGNWISTSSSFGERQFAPFPTKNSSRETTLSLWSSTILAPSSEGNQGRSRIRSRRSITEISSDCSHVLDLDGSH